MRRLKLVFYVEDADTKEIVVEKSQMFMEFTDGEPPEFPKKLIEATAINLRIFLARHLLPWLDSERVT